MPLVIVSGYTEEYTSHAKRLRCELTRLEGPVISITAWGSRGEWMANCRLKAAELLRVQTGCELPVLWIDVDASILCMPSMPLYCDFAACPSRAGIGRRWCTGTLFFNNSNPGRKLLHRWQQLCCGADSGTDEFWLNEAYNSWEGSAAELPREYGWLPGDGKPHEEVVIQHRLSGNARKRSRKIAFT